MARRRKPKGEFYMVIRTDNFGGCGLWADSPEHAVVKAQKYAGLKAAPLYRVRTFLKPGPTLYLESPR